MPLLKTITKTILMKKIYLIIAYVLFICLFGSATWEHNSFIIAALPLFIFATWGFLYLWKKAS